MKEIIFLTILSVAVLAAIFFYIRVWRLQNLADSFSRQYASLAVSARKAREKLETVMNLFSSPVLIIDDECIISFANREAKKVFLCMEMQGRDYLEFFREPEFIAAVKGFHEKEVEEPLEREVVIDGKVFKMLFSPIGKSGDIFVSCKDITGIRELEKVKRDLVTNMSHELKTPLTAIKGYLETLAEEIPAEQENHLQIIRKHTDRLISIVGDILSLSALEETQKTEFRIMDIQDILNDVLKMFAGKIKNKKLSVKTIIDTEDRHIEGDRFKIEEAFINIIDNAIRYTDSGGIEIRSFKDGGSIVISVKDTGIGIPGKSLPRIFERFYVVDKSRSKETGGTGLGLSIVKHIITLHNGTIDIKSSSGSGTEVIITFPLVKNP